MRSARHLWKSEACIASKTIDLCVANDPICAGAAMAPITVSTTRTE